VSFIDDRPPAFDAPGGDGFRADVRIRHRGAPIPSTVRPAGGDAIGAAADPDGSWTVETDAPVWAAAPGQAAVLYAGERCLGGGRIDRPARIDAGSARAVA
jgi:tRNA-specific 2-thiouridylase